MDEKGYGSVDEFLGIATDASLAYSEMPPEKAHVNAERCTNCGRCLKACFYQAMQPGDEATWVDMNNCIGCGGCYSVCPAKGAIEISVVS